MKLNKNQLPHIDNNFYILTPAQAKALSFDGELPRPGYEKRAIAERLSAFTLGKIERYPLASDQDHCRFRAFNCKASDGWICETPLSWFNGAPVKSGRVLALHVTRQ